MAFSLLSYIISLIFAGRRSNVGTIFADLYFNIDAIMIPFKHHAMNTHDYYKLMENHFKPYFKAGNDYHRRIRKAIQEWDYGVDFDFATERKQ